jgi:hypothetical protein
MLQANVRHFAIGHYGSFAGREAHGNGLNLIGLEGMALTNILQCIERSLNR